MKLIKNSIPNQDKSMGDQISFTEWNSVVNQLSYQANKIAYATDDHIEDLDNPHEVTAEQVGTYVKSVIDNKGAAVLQQAKDYTYDRDTIDNKDANTLQEAKDYTYSQATIDNKDAAVLQQAKDYTYSQVEIDLKDTTKVDKTTTIIGLDLKDDILIDEFRTYLGNATQSVAGLLSAEDKTHLDGLVALLETSDSNNVVDTIGEILAIFQNYPEGADLVTVLQGKVDKVEGMGLSENDLTDTLKSNYDTAYGWGDHTTEGYLKEITKAMVEAVLTGTITSHNHNDLYYTESEIDVMLQGLPVAGHTHTESDITDLDKYTQAQVDTLLNSKVDKVAGMGLSKNDFTDEYKNKVDDVIDDVSQLQTGKQNKLTAGTNITIDENTNVISASGGMATVGWQDVENKPELYDKSEIDLMLGDIGNALDAILGV